MKTGNLKKLRQAHPALYTLVCAGLVVLCSIALALCNKNGSTYATGLWDDGSQALVFGRMLQMQQNQSAPGGFMGVYTEEWGDNQNRYLYRDNTPVTPQQFQSYTHQTGLQGFGFAVLNKLLTVVEDKGEARETILYTLNSVLFYAATITLCLGIAHSIGAVPALCWGAAALLSPWVQRGMKDLYWCLWTWLLPALAALLLCALTRRRGKTPPWCYVLVGACCMLRCMCGFEFISTFLILCEIPLVYCWAQALPQHKAGAWFVRMVRTGFAAVGGVAAALGIWLVQGWVYYGSLAQSAQNITGAVTTRVSVSDDSVRGGISIAGVVHKYLVADATPVLRLGGVEISVLQLLAITVAALALTAAVLMFVRRTALANLLPLLCVWVCAFAAPLSWLVLSKAHADIHVQLVPMLWHFAFVPACCMLLGALAVQLCKAAAQKAHR